MKKLTSLRQHIDQQQMEKVASDVRGSFGIMGKCLKVYGTKLKT